jgi:site-specific recombinase XerD
LQSTNGLLMRMQDGLRPLTRRAVYYLVRAAGKSVGLDGVHPHMLRHSCGYYLADQGTDLRTMQDCLGHRDPRHTVRYTRVAARRFEGLWNRMAATWDPDRRKRSKGSRP